MNDDAPKIESAPVPTVTVIKKPSKPKRVMIRPRHRQLLEELQKPEHKGQITKAMIALSFAPRMIDRPKAVTETKSWQALMEENFPEDVLAQRHSDLLFHRQLNYFVFPKNMSDEDIKGHVEANGLMCMVIRPSDKGKMAFYSQDDPTAISKGLEMAYKLKGKFVPEPAPTGNTNVYNLFYNPSVQQQVKAFEENLMTAIAGEVVAVKDNEVKDTTHETSDAHQSGADTTAGVERQDTDGVADTSERA